MRTTPKQRQPIALRAKTLKDGRKSLYLDYYDYSSRSQAHSHRYEFLKLYLLPDSRATKEQNRAVMQSAQTILQSRIIERAQGKAGIKANGDAILLSDYLHHYAEIKKRFGQSNSNARIINAMADHLREYKDGVTLGKVGKAFLLGFIRHLLTASGHNATKSRKPLSKSTVKIYFTELSAALNLAVKEEYISTNPASRLTVEERKAFSFDADKRTYLTVEEVKRLIATPMEKEAIKNAFLFACFCGLRISDISSLIWGEIHTDDGGHTWIEKQIKKTTRQITLPIPGNALRFLPERGEASLTDNVFGLGMLNNVNTPLKKWAKDAGIDKHVTFHVSRHTFATTLLTKGADLYTTSKLLGHSKIQTTQIYAEVVNEKKRGAIDLLDDIDI